MQHTQNRGHNLDFFYKNTHTFSLHFLSNERLYLPKIYFNFITEIVYSQPIRHIENFELFEFGHSMECYESINKGCICTVPLLRE